MTALECHQIPAIRMRPESDLTMLNEVRVLRALLFYGPDLFSLSSEHFTKPVPDGERRGPNWPSQGPSCALRALYCVSEAGNTPLAG